MQDMQQTVKHFDGFIYHSFCWIYLRFILLDFFWWGSNYFITDYEKLELKLWYTIIICEMCSFVLFYYGMGFYYTKPFLIFQDFLSCSWEPAKYTTPNALTTCLFFFIMRPSISFDLFNQVFHRCSLLQTIESSWESLWNSAHNNMDKDSPGDEQWGVSAEAGSL